MCFSLTSFFLYPSWKIKAWPPALWELSIQQTYIHLIPDFSIAVLTPTELVYPTPGIPRPAPLQVSFNVGDMQFCGRRPRSLYSKPGLTIFFYLAILLSSLSPRAINSKYLAVGAGGDSAIYI